MALYYTRRSGASVSLDLLERIRLSLASVNSKAAPALADQRNLRRFPAKLHLFMFTKILLHYFRVPVHLSVLLTFVSY